METKTIRLFDDRPDVILTTYTRPGKHPAVIVLPGGAYILFGDQEGEPVAMKFLSAGFCAFDFRYRIGEDARFPRFIQEVSAVVARGVCEGRRGFRGTHLF